MEIDFFNNEIIKKEIKMSREERVIQWMKILFGIVFITLISYMVYQLSEINSVIHSFWLCKSINMI